MARALLLLTMLLGIVAPALAQDPEVPKPPELPVLYDDPVGLEEAPPLDDVATWGPVAALAVLIVVGVYVGGSSLEYALWRWKWRRIQQARGVARAGSLNTLIAATDEIALTFDALPEVRWTPEVAMRLRQQPAVSPETPETPEATAR